MPIKILPRAICWTWVFWETTTRKGKLPGAALPVLRRWWQWGSSSLAAGALPQSPLHESGFAPASIRHENCSWSVFAGAWVCPKPSWDCAPGSHHLLVSAWERWEASAGQLSSLHGGFEMVLVCFRASDKAECGRNEYFNQDKLWKSCSCFSEAQRKEGFGCWFLSVHILLLFLLQQVCF